MSALVPAETPTLLRQEAELTDLRWVALHLLKEHRRSAYPNFCLCPICRAALRWVAMPELGEMPGVALASASRR